MTDFYVDHGVYGGANRIGLDNPAWGVPQDGDGSTKDAATAAAIASFLFGTVPTSGTISVCGVAISSTGVLNAASVDAAANALATNINATTTAVSASVATGIPQLRNLVYARGPSGGAPAGTCQIMMRVGSTSLNYATNAAVGIASTLVGTVTLTQFAGGSGGCWGWLTNDVGLGVAASIGQWAYGLMFGKPLVWLATPTKLDTIWVRTGSGKTITYSSGASATISLARIQSWPMRMVFDTNTIWTTDPGNGVFTLNVANTNSSYNLFVQFGSSGVSSEVQIQALMKGGFKFKLAAAVTSGSQIYAYEYSNAGVAVSFVNIDFEDAATNSGGINFIPANYAYRTAMSFRNCRFSRMLSATTLPKLISISAPENCGIYEFFGCEFNWNISGAGDPGSIVSVTAQTTQGTHITFDSCSFTGWVLGNNKFTLLTASGANFNNTKVQAINCTGLKLTAAYAGIASASNGIYVHALSAGYLFQSGEVGGPFRYEFRSGVVEFDPDAAPAYPLLSSVNFDGTPYALKVIWFNGGESSFVSSLRVPPLEARYRMAAAARTVTLQMLLRSAMLSSIDAGKVQMQVSYVNDATGAVVTEMVAGVPAASTASWTNAGSYAGYEARKLSLTTSNAIKAGTRIRVSLFLIGAPNAGQNEILFLDPEFEVA